MANYKTGPTRDWSDAMNLVVMAMVERGQEDSSLPGEFTHVFKGQADGILSTKEAGSSPKSVIARLKEIGWIEYKGAEKKFQGKAIWWVRNELITKEDASRADTLYRRNRREELDKKRSRKRGSAEPISHPEKVARFEVKHDELHPGNQVIRKANGPGETERLLRENRVLEEENQKLKAQVVDWEYEAKTLQQKLDQANIPQMEDDLELTRLMVRQLLDGGRAAEMLHKAARIANL